MTRVVPPLRLRPRKSLDAVMNPPGCVSRTPRVRMPASLSDSEGPNPEPHVDRTFRGGTRTSSDFHLSLLTRTHPLYDSLREQFLTKWKKEVVNLSVERIFKLEVKRRSPRYSGRGCRSGIGDRGIGGGVQPAWIHTWGM